MKCHRKYILSQGRKLICAVSHLVYPNQCIACGSLPYSNDIPLCLKCLFSISPLSKRFIDLSSLPEEYIPPMADTVALGLHQGPLQKAIHKLKQGHHFDTGQFLAYTLARILPKSFQEADVIAYVPSSQKGLRERGFNPAQILALEISRITGIPLGNNLLIKGRQTGKQALLSQNERMKNVEGAYLAPQNLENTKILLVDDVLTTGSTAVACANALIDVGGKIIGTAFYSYRPPFCT